MRIRPAICHLAGISCSEFTSAFGTLVGWSGCADGLAFAVSKVKRGEAMGQLSGITLFKLRGVAVKLHISLLFLIIYVLLVAMAQFPMVVKMSGIVMEDLTGTSFFWSSVFAIALLFSIIVHEFGHVWVAKAHGYESHSITLMALGGVSHIEKMPEKPLDEFKVAIIGPLVSLFIGGVLFGVRALSDSANIDFFCYWVGQTNIALGIFNLLPAYPMDGGRVLRSLFVSRQGLMRGTKSAVGVSHVFAWLLGIVGILQVNFLLMLLAFFIYAAAKSEFLMLTLQTVLKGLRAQDVADVSVPLVPEGMSLADVAEQMIKSRRLVLPVAGPAESYALISAEQVARIPLESRRSIQVQNIAEKISKPAQADEDLADVMTLIMQNRVGGIPVVKDHAFWGMIRTSDLLELVQLRQLAWEEKPIESWGLSHPAHSH